KGDHMRVLAAAALTLATLGGAAIPSASAVAPERLEFQMLRNGHPDGRHVVQVIETPTGMQGSSEVAIAVHAGPLTVFRFEQRCRETWAGRALAALNCSTLKQGQRVQVTAQRVADQILVRGQQGAIWFPAGALPTTWWVKPRSGAMIDTASGRPVE